MSRRQLLRDFEGRDEAWLRRATRLSAQVFVLLVALWLILLAIA